MPHVTGEMPQGEGSSSGQLRELGWADIRVLGGKVTLEARIRGAPMTCVKPVEEMFMTCQVSLED